jgi:hypothetical protein
MHFWACGNFVSTVGTDKEAIANYIKILGDEDKRLDQLTFLTEK